MNVMRIMAGLGYLGLNMSVLTNNIKIVTKNGRLITRIDIDVDAQAFLTATGIVNSTQVTAINNLVIGLKQASLWNKMKAIYPIVGGIAATHKYNLKDPRDLDAAFRLTYFNGVTHDSKGMYGGNAASHIYCDTQLNMVAQSMTLGNVHLSYYTSDSTTYPNTSGLGTFGRAASSYGANCLVINRTTYLLGSLIGGDASTNAAVYNGSNVTGLSIATTTSTTNNSVYQNGVLKASYLSANTGALVNLNCLIFSVYLVGNAYVSQVCRFASIGTGLTASDASNLYNIVQQYQTVLGRQV